MAGRQRKSLRLQARSTAAVKVKEEMDNDDDERKIVHTSRKLRRCRRSMYGFGTRYEYIMSITQRMKTSPADPVPEIGERLFHDVFECLINAALASQTEERKIVHTSRKLRRCRRSMYGFGTRYEYIMSITQRMKTSPADPVPEIGERLFHDVFECLINAALASQTEGTGDKVIEVDMKPDGSESLEPLAGREHYLEKIFTLLLCMARLRVYDPPSDNEVVYYREIKKHIRCMIAYNEAKGNTKGVRCADLKDPASYHSMSVSQTISAVEELIELSSTLAEINPQIWDLNHKNGSAPEVDIHVRSNFKSLPEPNWSAEKVQAFFYNKLVLVLHDLKCSGLAGLSPDIGEKKALDALLDYIASSSAHVKKVDKMAGSSDVYKSISTTTRKRERETYEVMLFSVGVEETNGLFDGRLFEYVHELRLSCLRFMLRLMDKVGIVVYPEKLHRRFGEDATDIINQWMNKQKVHREKSLNYIEDIDQCIVLARYAAALIKGISSSVHDAFANLTDMLRRQRLWHEFGPEALRGLSLLDCGAFRKAGDRMEIPLHAISSCDNATKTKHSSVISLESNADNLRVLATILHVLKDIGPLDAFVAPSPRESALLEQILEHVSLCIDGFLTTKAFQVERELTVAPASTLVRNSTMHRINKNGMFRGFSLVYFAHGGKYLVESLFEDFERVHKDVVDLMIPSLENFRAAHAKE